MSQENKTAIYFTDEGCELVKRFFQYRDLWSKIFLIKDGSVELHFNSRGEIEKVRFNTFQKVAKSYPQLTNNFVSDSVKTI